MPLDNKITIVFCAERGRLENQAKLLIDSIKTFFTSQPFFNIICYSPRKDYQPSKQFELFLQQENIVHVKEILNNTQILYPYSNKIYATSHAEQILGCKNILFIDTDQVIVNDLTEILSLNKDTVLVSPCYYKNIGAILGQPIPYEWEMFLSYFEIQNPTYSTSIFDNVKTISNWNSGFLYTNIENFYSKWETLFNNINDNFTLPYLYKHHSDQISLSLLIMKENYNFSLLPYGVNFGIWFNYKKENYAKQILTIDNLYTIHYGNSFNKYYIFNPINQLIDSPKKTWIIKKLKEYSVFDKSITRAIKRNLNYIIQRYLK